MTPVAGPAQSDGPMAFVDSLDSPELDEIDRHHLARVLRVRPGSPMIVCDGRGSWRPAVFGDTVEPTGEIRTVPAPSPPLTIGFALIKGDRPEMVVQKLTELGIDRIVGFTSEHCVVRWDATRAGRQHERWVRVAREAAMQCRRTTLPTVAPLTTFDALANSVPPPMIADLDGARLDADVFADVAGHGPVLLIGPEGGWSSAERATGLRSVRIGDHVLRAETASIAAATLLTAERAAARPLGS